MNDIEYGSSKATYNMSSVKLYQKLHNGVSGMEPFPNYKRYYGSYEHLTPFKGFPEHLTLPKGKPEGMKFKMFFYLSSYYNSKQVYIELPFFGKVIYDGKPYGFPLDRPMNTWKSFTPNMYFKDVYIYNMKDSKNFTDY